MKTFEALWGLRGKGKTEPFPPQPSKGIFFMRKSFILYSDTYDTLQHLNDEQLGKLMRMIFEYQTSGKTPETNNPLFIAFGFIKSSLDRDGVKYEQRAERSRENGAKGGRPTKNQLGKNETQKTQRVISKPKKPDSDSVSVSDSVNDSVNTNKIYKSVDEIKKEHFADEKINSLFIQFLSERIARKKYPTDNAIQLLIKQMRKIYKTKEEVIEGLELAIANGWTGLYELNKNNSKQQANTAPTKTRASMGVKME